MDTLVSSILDPAPLKRVLIVEDDLALMPILKRMIRLVQPSVQIDWTTNAEEAFSILKRANGAVSDSGSGAEGGTNSGAKKGPKGYDVVLSDISLEGETSGIDLAEACFRDRISAHFVLTSAAENVDSKLPILPKPPVLSDVKAYLGPYLRVPEPPGPPPASGLGAIGGWEETGPLDVAWFYFILFFYVLWLWEQTQPAL